MTAPAAHRASRVAGGLLSLLSPSCHGAVPVGICCLTCGNRPVVTVVTVVTPLEIQIRERVPCWASSTGMSTPLDYTLSDGRGGGQEGDSSVTTVTISRLLSLSSVLSFKAVKRPIITLSNHLSRGNSPSVPHTHTLHPEDRDNSDNSDNSHTPSPPTAPRPGAPMPNTPPAADPWATLPPNWRTPHPKQPPPAPARAPYHRSLPELTLPTCRPHCTRCHHPEGRGQCRTCVMVCDHTQDPKPVDVCIIRTRAQAAERRGPGTGRTLLLVPDCPHCAAAHTHSTEPTHPYRRAGCGQPYLLETR